MDYKFPRRGLLLVMKIVVFDVETTGIPRQAGNYFKKIKSPSGTLTTQRNHRFRGEVIQISALESSLESPCVCERFLSHYTDPTEPISVGATLNAHSISDQPDCFRKGQELRFAGDRNCSEESLLAEGFKKLPYIRDLAKGKSLEHFLCDDPEFSKLFREPGTIFVGHNISGFDMKVINDQLLSSNCPQIDFGLSISNRFELQRVDPSRNYYFDTMKVGKFLLSEQIIKLTGKNKNPKLSEALHCLGLEDDYVTQIAKQVVPGFSEETSYHNADFDVVTNWLVFILLLRKLQEVAV